MPCKVLRRKAPSYDRVNRYIIKVDEVA
jgi:hypothetical protein